MYVYITYIHTHIKFLIILHARCSLQDLQTHLFKGTREAHHTESSYKIKHRSRDNWQLKPRVLAGDRLVGMGIVVKFTLSEDDPHNCAAWASYCHVVWYGLMLKISEENTNVWSVTCPFRIFKSWQVIDMTLYVYGLHVVGHQFAVFGLGWFRLFNRCEIIHIR